MKTVISSFFLLLFMYSYGQKIKFIPQTGYKGFTELSLPSDEKYLVTDQINSNAIQVWDINMQKVIKNLDGINPSISPDDRLLAFFANNELKLYEFETGKIINTNANLEENKKFKNNLEYKITFSNDSKTIAISRTDENGTLEFNSQLKLYHIEENKVFYSAKGNLALFTNNDKSLIFSFKNHLYILDLQSMKKKVIDFSGDIYSIAELPGSGFQLICETDMNNFNIIELDAQHLEVKSTNAIYCRECGFRMAPWKVEFLNDTIEIISSFHRDFAWKKTENSIFYNRAAGQLMEIYDGEEGQWREYYDRIFINPLKNTVFALYSWNAAFDDYGYCLQNEVGKMKELDIINRKVIRDTIITCSNTFEDLVVQKNTETIITGGKSHLIFSDLEMNTKSNFSGFSIELRDIEFNPENNDIAFINDYYSTIISLDRFQSRELGWSADICAAPKMHKLIKYDGHLYFYDKDYTLTDSMHLESGNYRDAMIRISIDEKTLAYSAGNTIYVYNLKSKTLVKEIQASCFYNYGVETALQEMEFSPSGRYIYAINKPGSEGCFTQTGLVLYDLHKTDDNSILPKASDDDYNWEWAAMFSPDEKYLLYVSPFGKILNWFDLEKSKVVKKMNFKNEIQSLTLIPGGNEFFINSHGTLIICNLTSGKIISEIQIGNQDIKIIRFNKDSSLLALSMADNTVILYNWKQKKKICNIMTSFGRLIMYCDDHYYMASKEFLKSIVFTSDGKGYNFEQFDIIYNRPDVILKRIGLVDSSLINMYEKAYFKRLKKLNLKLDDLKKELHVPQIQILDKTRIPVNTSKKELNLKVSISDSKYKLESLNVWVNDVPLFGSAAYSLKYLNTSSYEQEISLELSEGENIVTISCLNEKGVESLKESFMIRYNPIVKTVSNLYLITIGVSDYLDTEMKLKYSVKDGRDIAGLFINADSLHINKLFIDTLFNKDAVRGKIQALKSKLSSSTVDDIVIISVSGHGLLDKDLNFYFATYDIDFKNPSEKGLLFTELENLLDSIPARKKLLLVDACHSGEADKDYVSKEIQTNIVLNDGSTAGLNSYAQKGVKIGSIPSGLGLDNSFELMQSMFTDLSNGTGTIVIAAAAATGYALEGETWKNGVFTYAFIDALKNLTADYNGNGSTEVTELKAYIIDEVERLTGGQQKPTVRIENLNFNWRIW